MIPRPGLLIISRDDGEDACKSCVRMQAAVATKQASTIKQAEIRGTTHDDDGATPYELAGNGSDGTNDAGGKAKDEAVQAED